MLNSVSEVNARFREIQELKTNRSNLKTQEDQRLEAIMAYVKKNGPVLVYKGDKAILLEIKPKTTKKLDKQALAESLGMAVKQLSAATMAKLVEQGKLTSQRIAEFETVEVTDRLSQRKARKREIEQFRNQK
ncbi:hypothetical protein P4637_17510 [Halalkalibacterium halodurans]|uniref:hypothetical protein n=1 Tax=Halalkalibacterium halodurans TaxID=86665 RepID=UPI002E2325F5|nr:hypothetical protein [Halalkalibacterium halodurans]MED4082043.1 hypothetical protein [Halalkalibacterium halodurans]MED4086612.1 hypothetical protein [Halalkalibacterium halodurans]MED4104526.1 hypothetical protein [Halalkalibacterium halodurans]MED4110114.1 hypothetical protein [Halalkalibacterium halodurans]